jgi:hypothetical protein
MLGLAQFSPIPMKKNASMMTKVFYKGHSYEYTVSEKDGVRLFSLYENGVLRYNITESDLDKRSVVSLVLDNYFGKERPKRDSRVEQ